MDLMFKNLIPLLIKRNQIIDTKKKKCYVMHHCKAKIRSLNEHSKTETQRIGTIFKLDSFSFTLYANNKQIVNK